MFVVGNSGASHAKGQQEDRQIGQQHRKLGASNEPEAKSPPGALRQLAVAEESTKAESAGGSDGSLSPFASLARGSPGAASTASNSSGAGSAADAALLSTHQRQSAAGGSREGSTQGGGRSIAHPNQNQQDGGPAPSRLHMLRQRVWRGLVRFVLWPLFGYDPSRIEGEWLPSDAYSAR